MENAIQIQPGPLEKGIVIHVCRIPKEWSSKSVVRQPNLERRLRRGD